jgi:hypothetical protein
LIALAVGFDDVELTRYQLRFSRFLATVAGGLGVLISAFRYIWERQKELAWEKTRFMAELFKEFEEDPTFRRAQELIDDSWASRDTSYLERILGPFKDLRERHKQDRRSIDRYLDFFDHLYTYVFITKTLSPSDVASFSGYAIDILDSPALSRFAIQMGYEDVLRLALFYRRKADDENRAQMVKHLTKEVENRHQK